MEIVSASLDAGKAHVRFQLRDPKGLALDREGLLTEGAVETRFVLSHLDPVPGGPGRYVAYTTTTQTSPITGDSAVQPSSDSGGAFTLIDAKTGLYEYTFGADVSTADPTRTHRVGAWAWRDVDGKRYVSNSVWAFRPDAGTVTEDREIVETAACNGCHQRLEAHGGARRDVALCVTCHAAGVVDPDTGNALDMSTMVHKIHRGKDLPSVKAGTPYQLVGFMQQTSDYSTVAFPQPVQQCVTCHTGPDADVWKNNPTRQACASCHDDVSFATTPEPGKVAHVGGPQADETDCKVCHTPTTGGLESIPTKHLTPFLDPAAPKLAAQIVSVSGTGPGETPELVLQVTVNGQVRDLLAAPLTRLVVTVAGPTTDYATYWQYTLQGTGATGTLAADPQGFRYTFPAPMPATAAGSYAFALEGYIQSPSTAPRYSMDNPIAFAAVTDPAPVPRREIVTRAQCNGCHSDLNGHGGARREPNYCAMCHNPNNINDERVGRFEGVDTTAYSVDLRSMVHRIHMGEGLSQPYVLGGFPAPTVANPAGTPIDFGEVRYPGDQRNCGGCHVTGSFSLPLQTGLLPTHEGSFTCDEAPAADGDSYCQTRLLSKDTVTGPTASACLGCHDAPETRAHAMTNTDQGSGVEACATCHSKGDTFDADVGHAMDP